jgi:hypothetical protein
MKLGVHARCVPVRLLSHSLRHLNTQQGQRLVKSFAHHLDEIKEAQLPLAVGLSQDAMALVELAEGLGKAEAILGEH